MCGDKREKHDVSLTLWRVSEKRVSAMDSIKQSQHSVIVIESKTKEN